jgi:hypothetical protein
MHSILAIKHIKNRVYLRYLRDLFISLSKDHRSADDKAPYQPVER